MNSISFLGTGSGIPSADRAFSSSVLLISGRHLLVDAGEPCVHLLCDRGNLIREIDAVLITHGHVDHIGGIPAFLQGAMLLKRTKPLPIYLPEEMIAPLRMWIKALYLPEEGFGFSVIWEAWHSGQTMQLDGGLSVTAHPNDHLEGRSLPSDDLLEPSASYSLEIFSGDFRVLFSGDLSSPASLPTLLANPVNVLVCELSHFRAEQLADALCKITLGSLCLVHLSEDYAFDRTVLQEYLMKRLPLLKDVMIPDDGEIIDF